MEPIATTERPVPIIVDTDIGEDIDDLLVLCFALNSPEFDVLAVTTVDGDTQARSRIARRVAAAYGRPGVAVAAGYTRSMPAANEPVEPLLAVTQNDVAPSEDGLPPHSPLPADELIARTVAARPGEVFVLTIGSMTNVGQAVVRFPAEMKHVRAIVSNGGAFGPNRQTTIGWNLRYDPVAVAAVACSGLPWVLLSEGTTGPARPTAEDVARLAARGLETTRVMMTAIAGWRKNKRECNPTSVPHVSDLNVFAYLLGEVPTVPGGASITVGPRGQLAGLTIQEAAEGEHRLGCQVAPGRAGWLHDLLMDRLLAELRRTGAQ